VNNTSEMNKDLHLYLLDRAGHQIWKATLTGSPRAIASPPDGRRIVVGADNDRVQLLPERDRPQRFHLQRDTLETVELAPMATLPLVLPPLSVALVECGKA
jgi:hypothetical protein